MVAVPRVLLVIPGIAAGIFVPTVIWHSPKPAPPHTVGMTFLKYDKNAVKVHRGDYLTIVDDSRNIHVIGPGQSGQIVSPVRGEPVTGYHMLETNGMLKTGPWTKVGTFHMTCSVHPDMNIKVVVVP